MILELEHWHLGYAQILKDCRTDQDSSAGTVWILCNADVDAMAAARILCYMLRSDGVPYQLRPCSTFSKLKQSLSNEDCSDVRAAVLLNLGASRNLVRLFDNDKDEDNDEDNGVDNDDSNKRKPKVYVMDCRRPFHLANIHAGENVVLFVDQGQLDVVPSDGDNLSGNESTSSESGSGGSDESDSDSENEAELDDLDEGEQEFQDPYDKEAKEAQNLQKEFAVDNESDRDYDGDLENDDNDDGRPGSRRRTKGNRAGDASTKRMKLKHGKQNKDDNDSDSDDGGDDSVDNDNDSANDISSPIPKDDRNRNVKSKVITDVVTATNPRELHRQRRDRLRLYYSGGSYYGSPAAYVAYTLSMQLRFGHVGDLLWLACVGVTDAYMHSRIDVTGYTTLAMDLRRHVDRLYPNDMYQRVSNAVYAEHLTGNNSNPANGTNGTSARNAPTQLRLSENGRILTEKDYRFFLLRHSSLLDSMVHSNYVSTKLQLWTNQGMQKLQELLAKMGYPLTECRQPYAFMKPTLRRRLREMIELHAGEYGLDSFEFTSFFRVTGYNSLLSASDMSYAVTALLEVESPATSSIEARVVTPIARRNDNDDDDKADETSAENDEERASMHAFNIAYDALNANGATSIGPLGTEGTELSSFVNGGNTSGSTGIGAGIRLAMDLQRSIISTSVNLVERNAITRLRHFRYAYITCTSQGSHGTRGGQQGGRGQSNTNNTNNNAIGTPSKDEEQSHVFAKPLALTKLAHYLMDMHRENGKWAGKRAGPLVLIAEKPRTGTYMVVGYEYPEKHGHFVRNRFGEKFELAAKTMQGTFKFDSFDSNVVEVNGSDAQRFIEQLHYMMDSM